METIWIIGVGQFGMIALERLSASKNKRQFVLVDPVGENLEKCRGPNRILVKDDGVRYVTGELQNGNEPEWIIPALPVHLAAAWCMLRLGPGRIGRVALPDDIHTRLPNPFRGQDGNIYVSHADFICPDDCAEPGGVCTKTGLPRKRNMFELLADITVGTFRSRVIRSHQLGPGIGGYRPAQLFDLLEQVTAATGDLLVCTACRCHGVLTGLRRY